MRHRVKRRIRRRAAPKVRRCACNFARAEARERMAGSGGLMIGGAKDPAEARADARATRALATAPTVHRKCAGCEAEDTAQRSPAAGVVAPGTSSSPAPKTALKAVNALGPGRPLSAPDRAFYEPRLNADLSAVRLHENAAADTAARAMDAQAFTLGTDIAFARGERAKGGPSLMAHELAHAAEGDGGVRRVASPTSHCRNPPPGMSELEAVQKIAQLDVLAMEMCERADLELSAEAAFVLQNGVRDSAIYRHFRSWFGRPEPRPHNRFASRFQPVGFPTEREAAASDMLIVAVSYRTLAARFSNSIIYRCPGSGRYRLPGDPGPVPCPPGVHAETNTTPNLAVVAICNDFWVDRGDVAMAAVLVHEMAHARLNYNDRAETICRARNRIPECIAGFLRFREGEHGDIIAACLPITLGHGCFQPAPNPAAGVGVVGNQPP